MAPAAFAATNLGTTAVQVQDHGFHVDMKPISQEDRQEKQNELMELVQKYTPELTGQFQALMESQQEKQAKVEAIREQVKTGTLTEEEANTQLKELGVKSRGHRGDNLHS